MLGKVASALVALPQALSLLGTALPSRNSPAWLHHVLVTPELWGSSSEPQGPADPV